MLANFSQLGMTNMKTPAETRSRVIEIDKAAKLTQEITGEAIADSHFKSILVGMLDPLTRQHTSSYMGSNNTSEELKRAILEFTTNVVMDNNDAMQIGALGGTAWRTRRRRMGTS